MKNVNVSDYVLLAEASYADFSNGLSKSQIDEALMESTEKNKNVVNYITNNYEVVAHWKDRGNFFTSADKDQSSGFSGTLFHKKSEGNLKRNLKDHPNESLKDDEYVLALRATKIGQHKSAGCFSDVSSVKSSLHFINGAES